MDNPVNGDPAHRKITIIFNPVAGNRRHALLDEVVAALAGRGVDISVIGTTGPGNATQIAAQAILENADIVVAAGGDGTINEVVSGVIGSNVPVGIIPMGTANVLALELGLPRRPVDIAAALTDGHTRPLHLARVNGRRFLLMAGAGFDGQGVHAITPGMKRRWGKYAFLLQGLRAILSNPARNMTVEADGQHIAAAWVVVTNISRYGGPYTLVPGIDPGAASLVAVVFRNAGPFAMCRNMTRIGLGIAVRSGSVTTIQATRFLVRGPDGTDIPVQIDGDAAGTLPIEIAASDEFVRILAPPLRR